MKILLAVFLAIAAAGCSHTVGNFSMISNGPVDLSQKYVKAENKVLGEDVMHIYFLVPTKMFPDVSGALKDALEKECASYLTDATLTYRWWTLVLFAEFWFEIEGNPWYLDGEERQICLRKKGKEVSIR